MFHKGGGRHLFPGRKLGFTIDLGKLHNVSLGQGQEAVAEVAMEKAAKEGHWVILQVWLKENVCIDTQCFYSYHEKECFYQDKCH